MQFGEVYKALHLLLKEKQSQGEWKDRKRIGFKVK